MFYIAYKSDNTTACKKQISLFRLTEVGKTFKTPIYNNLEFAFTTSTYSTTGNTYVGIHCKENDCIEPYCNLTVNLDMQLGKVLAFIDVNNADRDLLLFLEEQGFISPTGVTRPSGFVVYPLYRLNLDKIGEYKF